MNEKEVITELCGFRLTSLFNTPYNTKQGIIAGELYNIRLDSVVIAGLVRTYLLPNALLWDYIFIDFEWDR